MISRLMLARPDALHVHGAILIRTTCNTELLYPENSGIIHTRLEIF